MASQKRLGDRAPIMCDIGDADGVAMAFMERGTKVTPLPFQHPPLLDNEVRIKVTYAGLCHSDMFEALELWDHHGGFPLVPGHEIVGEVTKLGEKVTKFQEGEKVGFGVFSGCCGQCYECRTSTDNVCLERKFTYNPAYGGYATSFQNTSDFFFKLDDSFPGEAAPIFCAGSTVYAPLHRFTRPGMKVGIVGIGGLGHMGIKFARKFGCEVTAISTSASKEQEAYNLGAHHFINTTEADCYQKHARSLDFILNTATKIDLSKDFTLVKPRGGVAIVGLPDSEHNCNLSTTQLLMGQQELHGSNVASRLEIEEMLEFSKNNNVYPTVEIYQFENTQAAVNSLADGNPHFPKYRNVLSTSEYFKTFSPRTN